MATIQPAELFSPDDDSKALRFAMKSFRADGTAILKIVCARSSEQRQEIVKAYKQMYGRNLINDFKKELRGNFRDLIVGLMTPLLEYLAQVVSRAIAGFGTDEDALIEVICTRNNKEINEIKDTFRRLYGKCMEEEVTDNLSGDFRHLMAALMNAKRPENVEVDEDKARREAQELLDACTTKWSTDTEVFIAIFCSNSVEQLMRTFDEYRDLSGTHIIPTIQKGMRGDLRKAMITMVESMMNTPLYYAERLFTAMEGIGTDDSTLVRIIVARCEVDLADIRQEYLRVHDRTIEFDIKENTSGVYKKSLLKITGGGKKKKLYD